MPLRRLYIFVLLLGISGMVNATTSIRLYSMERTPVKGASFLINGLAAKSEQAGIYTFDSLPQPPYHIHVSAKGFLATDYAQRQILPGEIFLLRKGEDHYYSSGYKVPCVNARKLLIVTMLEKDSAGHALQPDETRRRLESIAAPLHLVVAEAYHDKLKTQIVPKGETRSVMWDHTYLLRLESNKDFPDTSAELATLRENKAVRFAGPVLSSDKNYLKVFSYKPQVTVSFTADVQQAEALALLDSLGYKKIAPANISGHQFYTIVLPPATGMEMNRVVEKLIALSGVSNVQPELWMIK